MTICLHVSGLALERELHLADFSLRHVQLLSQTAQLLGQAVMA